jgi:hypothetical protein
MLLLGQRGDTWAVTATGRASPISTLRYLPKDDVFRSPNGELKRLKDVKVEASGILGAWSGQEWRFEEDTGLGKTLESVAIGRFADNKFAIIFYHVQEVSTEGTVLLDKSLVVRFALGKAGQLKDPKAAPTKPTKTETGKGGKSTPKK